jgi:lipid A 3-O-deacylase
MKLGVTALAAGLACWAGANAAEAKILDGFTVGALVHSVPAADIKNSHKEHGADIQLEADFKTPGFLEWALHPQPYVIATLNTQGDTSYVGFGFNWRFGFGDDKWGFEPIVGYVVHNGDTQDPYPKSDPRYGPYFNEHLLLGSKDLFRLGLGVSRRFGDKVEGQLMLEHLSHGYILGDEVNQGLDNAGLRLIYKY